MKLQMEKQLATVVFFNSIVDVKRTGEIRTFGVTSWSNFDEAKKINMLIEK